MLRYDAELYAQLNRRDAVPLSLFELYPAADRDAGDVLDDGAMERWTSGNVLQEWGAVVSNGTLVRDESVRWRGWYSARYDKTADGYGDIYQWPLSLVPGAWYELQARCRVSLVSDELRMVLRNLTQNKDVAADGTTWAAPSQTVLQENAGTAWQLYRRWVRVDPTFTASDQYRLYVIASTNLTVGESIWWDDVHLVGPYDQAALYYASRGCTFGLQTYAPLVVACDEVSEGMGLSVPDTALRVSNTNRTLIPYLSPDVLTGGRVVVRTTYWQRNATGDITGEVHGADLVRFVGTLKRPTDINDQVVVLPAVGLLDGRRQRIPRRKAALWCGATFADGVDCKYTETTTVSGAPFGGVTTNVVDGSNLNVGDHVTIGASSELLIDSKPSANQITTTEAVTKTAGDPVALTRCNRELPACTQRGRLHEFQGFPGVANTARLALLDGLGLYRHGKFNDPDPWLNR